MSWMRLIVSWMLLSAATARVFEATGSVLKAIGNNLQAIGNDLRGHCECLLVEGGTNKVGGGGTEIISVQKTI